MKQKAACQRQIYNHIQGNSQTHFIFKKNTFVSVPTRQLRLLVEDRIITHTLSKQLLPRYELGILHKPLQDKRNKTNNS